MGLMICPVPFFRSGGYACVSVELTSAEAADVRAKTEHPNERAFDSLEALAMQIANEHRNGNWDIDPEPEIPLDPAPWLC